MPYEVPPSIALEPELLRLLAFGGFWLIVAVGMLLTKLFADVDLENTLLTEVFGYNNICVYFDFPPSTYVLPILYAPAMVCYLLYIATQVLHMMEQVQRGEMSARLFFHLRNMKAFEALSLLVFSNIFAVSPEAHDFTLWIHTAPFWLLQLGMVSMAISNTIQGITTGYWKSLDVPEGALTAAKVYVAVFAITVCFKIPSGLNSMLHQRWWKNSPEFVAVSEAFDTSFLLCGAVVPMCKAAFLRMYRRDKLKVVHIGMHYAEILGESP